MAANTPPPHPSDWTDATWLAFHVKCPHCNGEFMVRAEDRLKITACPFCVKVLPVGEGRVQ